MNREFVFQRILQRKLIAIVRGQRTECLAPLAEALYRGGVDLVEVTFQQDKPETWADTAQGIRAIGQLHGDALLAGAGTVMTVEQVRLAHAAGARYIISPNTEEAVIRETLRLGMVSLPGALTPTEIAQAAAYGADAVKVFPAGCLGAAYLKALCAPLAHIPLLAVGGINERNAAEYLRAGCVGFGVGGQLVNAELMEAGRYEEITEIASRYRAAVEGSGSL
ncbi:MAG: bifunctional 4-hydroxy-2-oxoglutarate aldolase/2-dehydro-3-deoxy-phosphogluconate aldolase [Clostridia bacterium]